MHGSVLGPAYITHSIIPPCELVGGAEKQAHTRGCPTRRQLGLWSAIAVARIASRAVGNSASHQYANIASCRKCLRCVGRALMQRQLAATRDMANFVPLRPSPTSSRVGRIFGDSHDICIQDRYPWHRRLILESMAARSSLSPGHPCLLPSLLSESCLTAPIVSVGSSVAGQPGSVGN